MLIAKSIFYVHHYTQEVHLLMLERFTIKEIEIGNKIDRLTRLVAAPGELYQKNI